MADPQDQPLPDETPAAQASIMRDGGRQMAMIVYVLFFISYLIGLTGIIGVALAHLTAGKASAVYRSHFQYQIRTFWYGMLMAVICLALLLAARLPTWAATAPVTVGLLGAFFIVVWSLVRLIKGTWRLSRRQSIENPTTLLW